MSLLTIENLSHAFSENTLYQDCSFFLNPGEHIGIVGQNGSGKSTLIKILTQQIIPDSGRILWRPDISLGYLDQYAEIDPHLTIRDFLKSAFAGLYAAEAEMLRLYQKMAEGDIQYLKAASAYQEQLENSRFYLIDTQIEQTARGLGLTAVGLDRPVSKISGGQRAKVILAKLLLENPDVLLLDEPTNFLDKEQISWLADYLSGNTAPAVRQKWPGEEKNSSTAWKE